MGSSDEHAELFDHILIEQMIESPVMGSQSAPCPRHGNGIPALIAKEVGATKGVLGASFEEHEGHGLLCGDVVLNGGEGDRGGLFVAVHTPHVRRQRW